MCHSGSQSFVGVKLCLESWGSVRGRPCSWWKEGGVVVEAAGRGGSVRTSTDRRSGPQNQGTFCARLAARKERQKATHGSR